MDYPNTTTLIGLAEDVGNSSYSPDCISHFNRKYIDIVIILCLLGTIGVIANAVLIVIILINRKMRCSAIILIVNASIGEIIMLAIYVPFNTTYFITSYWPFGDFLCKALNGIVTFSSAVTMYTFVALSFDRYVAVAYPLEPNRAWTITRTIVIQLIINIFGVMVCIPKVVTARESYLYTCPKCLYLNHGTITAKVYVILSFMFSYVVPLLFTAFNYARIAHVLFKSVDTNKRHGVNHHTDHSRIRLAKTLLVMVIIYAACLLPKHIFSIGYQFMYHDFQRLNSFAERLYAVALVCFLCSSFVNPGVLFFITGGNFCKALKQQSTMALVRYRNPKRTDDTSSSSAKPSVAIHD